MFTLYQIIINSQIANHLTGDFKTGGGEIIVILENIWYVLIRIRFIYFDFEKARVESNGSISCLKNIHSLSHFISSISLFF